MKRITIIVCGFSLSIALVALPFQYMEHITSGLGLSLAAVLLAWIGILQRKSSQETYKHDVRLYSASTLMKVVVGYYAPNRPDIITENRPGKPVFGGFLCFFGAAVCLIFSILVFTGMMVSC